MSKTAEHTVAYVCKHVYIYIHAYAYVFIQALILEIKKIKDLKIGIGIEKKATKQG